MLRRDDIDIQDAYKRLFLEQSNTNIYRSDHCIYIRKIYISIYIRFMVSQNYTEVHTKDKNIEWKKWKYVWVYS